MYFTVDCAEQQRSSVQFRGSSDALQVCVDVRYEEFAAGLDLLPSIAALKPVNTALCIDEAWDKAAQMRYPPFAFLEFDDLRLLELGRFYDCMREMRSARAGAIR
jgi:hypothetical protein